MVVDNQGDYVLPGWAAGVEVVRTGENLRWIGTANWAFRTAQEDGDEVVVLLNNDTRLSRGFLRGLVGAVEGDVAIAAACYDDFWLHQRAARVPVDAEAYEPRDVDARRAVLRRHGDRVRDEGGGRRRADGHRRVPAARLRRRRRLGAPGPPRRLALRGDRARRTSTTSAA